MRRHQLASPPLQRWISWAAWKGPPLPSASGDGYGQFLIPDPSPPGPYHRMHDKVGATTIQTYRVYFEEAVEMVHADGLNFAAVH